MAAPLSPFEQRGRVAPWTTRAEGAAYVPELVSYSQTTPGANPITLSIAGQSVAGAPMYLMRMGTGPRTILFTAQQHGGELAGRDALFTLMREWTDTTDPDVLAYLDDVTVLFMPWCHPDNHIARNNFNNVNLNRDHVEITQPETQAIHATIRDWDPEVIVDLHEGQNIVADTATAPPYNLNAVQDVKDMAEDLSNTIKAAIEDASYTWELYQGPSNMMRGPENLHNNAAVQGRIGVLVETARDYDDDTDAERRHDLQLIAIDAIWRWHAANADDVYDVVTAARIAAAERTDPITLHIETHTTGPVVDPLPLGYLVTNAGWSALATVRDRFKITGRPYPDGYYIPLAQRQQTLIAYLVDPNSPKQVALGTATDEEPPEITKNTTGTAKAFKFRRGGVTYNATLRRG